MWSALMTFLFITASILLVSSRRSIRELKDTNAAAYRSGFMAGHVQGWNDCATAASAQRPPSVGLPAAAADVRGTTWARRPSAADAPDDASVDLSASPFVQPVEPPPASHTTPHIPRPRLPPRRRLQGRRPMSHSSRSPRRKSRHARRGANVRTSTSPFM
jgi:hypothetical protein